MEKELIKALVAMRYALKDVMDQLPIEERFFNLDYAAECDLHAHELLLKAGVDKNDMPA